MTDNTILPERRYLEMSVPIFELCRAYAERGPVYRMVFRLNMLNISRLNLRLLGRKWTMQDTQGNTFILEADHVFGMDQSAADCRLDDLSDLLPLLDALNRGETPAR